VAQALQQKARGEGLSTEGFLRLDFPCDMKFELIRGEVIGMVPARFEHGVVVGRLAQILLNLADKEGMECAVLSNLGVKYDGADMFVEPDLAVVCDKSKIADGWCVGGPEIVVEVLSRSTKDRDYGVKRDFYMEIGVTEYWIVDAEEKRIWVENFSAGTKVRLGVGEIVKSGAVAGFEFDVGEVFR
jgi:Uma2 family endonuclease